LYVLTSIIGNIEVDIERHLYFYIIALV